MDKAEKIASKKTADNKTIIFWSDGCITSWCFTYPKGTNGKLPLAAQAWLMGDIELFSWDELPVVIKRARTLFKKQPAALPGDYRRYVCAALPKIK